MWDKKPISDQEAELLAKIYKFVLSWNDSDPVATSSVEPLAEDRGEAADDELKEVESTFDE